MNVLLHIIYELFARSIAGVFVLADGEGLKLKFHLKSSWVLNTGLGAGLQYAPMQAVVRPHGEHDVQTIEGLAGTYDPLDPERCNTAATDHLSAELYRQGAEATRVLGLFRRRKDRGHGSGLCWHGQPTSCSVPGSYALAKISRRVLQARQEQRPLDGDLSDDLRPLFDPAPSNAEKQPSRTYKAGRCAVATIRAGSHGEDIDPHLPPKDEGGDLPNFVKID